MQQAHTFHDIRADIYKPTSQRSNLTAKMKDVTASGRIIKQGFLTKQALKSKRNWKQRWCVLQVRMIAHGTLSLSIAGLLWLCAFVRASVRRELARAPVKYGCGGFAARRDACINTVASDVFHTVAVAL